MFEAYVNFPKIVVIFKHREVHPFLFSNIAPFRITLHGNNFFFSEKKNIFFHKTVSDAIILLYKFLKNGELSENMVFFDGFLK